MNIKRGLTYLMVCGLIVVLHVPGTARGKSDASKVSPRSALRDGRHDFDFELGSWKIHIKRRLNPLAGSATWVEFDGTTVNHKIWDGAAIQKWEADPPTGHIEGLTLRLYNPQSHQWYLYGADNKEGTLNQPAIGEFKNGRGEFVDQEPLNGRVILVRSVWSNITRDSVHFEASFSGDGGKTWEVNVITDQTRLKDEPDKVR